jgi:hypothetical protein
LGARARLPRERKSGELDHLLPKVQKKEHYPSLPYAELPAFMAQLREKEGISLFSFRY